MLTSSLLQPFVLVLCALLVDAVPLVTRATSGPGKNFYLLATPEKDVKSKNAVGLSLFDPFLPGVPRSLFEEIAYECRGCGDLVLTGSQVAHETKKCHFRNIM